MQRNVEAKATRPTGLVSRRLLRCLKRPRKIYKVVARLMHNAWVKVSRSWFSPTSGEASWHLLRNRSCRLVVYTAPTGTYRFGRRGRPYQQDHNGTAPNKAVPRQNFRVVKRPVLHREGLRCDGALHEPVGQLDRAMLRQEKPDPSAQSNLVHAVHAIGFLIRWLYSPRMNDTIRRNGRNRRGNKETYQTLPEVPSCAVARHPGDARPRSAENSRQLRNPKTSRGSRIAYNRRLCFILHRIPTSASRFNHMEHWFTIANQHVTSRGLLDSIPRPDHRNLPSRRNISEPSGVRRATKFTLIFDSHKPR